MFARRRRGEDEPGVPSGSSPEGFEVVGEVPAGDLVSVKCPACGTTFQIKPEQADDAEAGRISCVNNNCPRHG